MLELLGEHHWWMVAGDPRQVFVDSKAFWRGQVPAQHGMDNTLLILQIVLIYKYIYHMGLTVNSMHYLRGCGWAMKGVPKFPPLSSKEGSVQYLHDFQRLPLWGWDYCSFVGWSRYPIEIIALGDFGRWLISRNLVSYVVWGPDFGTLPYIVTRSTMKFINI